MPKICYVPKHLGAARLAVVDQANAILEEYAAQGFDLTLRQLYYQFVARGVIPNRDTEYKKLGETINDARLAGLIDWDRIEDRTRNLRSLSHWDSPEDIILSCAKQYREDLWSTQSHYVEVWVEKDALVGVLQHACEPLDVSYFSCRGYVSQSEMWGAAMRLLRHLTAGKRVTILHLGDHDPSGVDMTRDIRDRITMFIGHHSPSQALRFSVNRIALNMDQIEQYNPPPNPAKITDARAAGYIAEYGDQSWELDALEPAVLTALIQDHVGALLEQSAWDEASASQDRGRQALTLVSDRWDDVVQFVRPMEPDNPEEG